MVDAARRGNPAKDYLLVACVLPGHRGVWYPENPCRWGRYLGRLKDYLADANTFYFGKVDYQIECLTQTECKLKDLITS